MHTLWNSFSPAKQKPQQNFKLSTVADFISRQPGSCPTFTTRQTQKWDQTQLRQRSTTSSSNAKYQTPLQPKTTNKGNMQRSKPHPATTMTEATMKCLTRKNGCKNLMNGKEMSNSWMICWFLEYVFNSKIHLEENIVNIYY